MSTLFTVLCSSYAPFLRYALLIGIVSSFAFGIMGTYVVTKRISYIAGAIAHSILGGIGAGLYFGFNPIIGAFSASIISAIIIGLVSINGQERDDTVIGAVWAIGMALGILFIAMTPGYATSLMSYLFGNILMVSRQDIFLIIIFNVCIMGICFCFYHKFLAVCFDESFAKLRGVKTSFYYLLLLCMIAVTIVLLVRVIGVIMVIALLTIPPAVASIFSKSFVGIITLSILFCMIFNTIGLAVSFLLNTPSGPTIIVIAGICYVLLVFAAKMKVIARS